MVTSATVAMVTSKFKLKFRLIQIEMTSKGDKIQFSNHILKACHTCITVSNPLSSTRKLEFAIGNP